MLVRVLTGCPTLVEAFMVRTARCSCGSLQVEVKGDPLLVVACHCIECQRRSGSVLAVGAHYLRENVLISGVSKGYVRDAKDGRKFKQHFCPNCGTSVFWEGDLIPGRISIFVGTFGDPSFPAPTRSVWERTRHSWIDIGSIPGHVEGRDSEQVR